MEGERAGKRNLLLLPTLIVVVKRMKDGGERKQATENLVGGWLCIFCNTIYVSQLCVKKTKDHILKSSIKHFH